MNARPLVLRLGVALGLSAVAIAGCGTSRPAARPATGPRATTSTPAQASSVGIPARAPSAPPSSQPGQSEPARPVATGRAAPPTTTAAILPARPVMPTVAAPPASTIPATRQPPATVSLSCGSIAFAPQSSYLATGIAATGANCRTARAVAQASRPHAYDPPAAGHPVADFAADGFTCDGTVDSHSVLELVTYRCTRGSAIVTFQRSA